MESNSIDYKLYAHIDKDNERTPTDTNGMPLIRICGLDKTIKLRSFSHATVLASANLRDELKAYQSTTYKEEFSAHLQYVFIHHSAIKLEKATETFNNELQRAYSKCQELQKGNPTSSRTVESQPNAITEEETPSTKHEVNRPRTPRLPTQTHPPPQPHPPPESPATKEAIDYWYRLDDECNDLLTDLHDKKRAIQTTFDSAVNEAQRRFHAAKMEARRKRKEDEDLLLQRERAVLAGVEKIRSDMRRRVRDLEVEELLMVLRREGKRRRVG